MTGDFLLAKSREMIRHSLQTFCDSNKCISDSPCGDASGLLKSLHHFLQRFTLHRMTVNLLDGTVTEVKVLRDHI